MSNRSNRTNTDKEILVVSFGSTYQETTEKTIGAIEKYIGRIRPDYSVCRCFTSSRIIAVLRKREGICIDDPAEALQKAAAEGIRDIIIQPTHIMEGAEYHKLLNEAEKYRHCFENMAIGRPLLTSEEDFTVMARAVLAHLPDPGEKTAVLLMGHGSDAPSNAVYRKMENHLRQEEALHHYFATVEGEPVIEDILPFLKEKQYEKIILSPFMVVAGRHAVKDLAGDTEDSWKGILLKEGFRVETVLHGIGEWREVQELFADHAAAAMKERQEDNTEKGDMK